MHASLLSHWHTRCFGLLRGVAALAFVATSLTLPVAADETCLSPFMPKITGQEDYVYVYTLGVEGLGRRPGQAGDDRRESPSARRPTAR